MMLFRLLPLCHTSFKRTCFLLIGLSLFINLSGLAQKPQPATLPAPYATKSTMNFSNVHGWENGQTPIAPEGFTVTRFADQFDNPRWMYVTSNGDILVAESNSNHTLIEKIGGRIIGASKSNNLSKSADRITLLRDTNQDGIPDLRTTFLKDLNQPFGMLVIGNWLYVANVDALLRFPYQKGQTEITEKGQTIMTLPIGEHPRHWTRNLLANADNTKIYVSVGSNTNVAEKGMEQEFRRADILEINPDGSGERIYASGLRNPVGMGWAIGTKTLWTVVNERDELGDDLVPDYLTSVKDGGFYGWPYSYFGQHVDPRVEEKRPDLVAKAIVPDVPLGSHTASLGLAFYNQKSFPKKYHNGAFIAQHGSWNRSVLSGYRVVFVPFENGKPSGKPQDFLTGFMADEKKNVYGRPVGVIVLPDGSLLVTDDVSNVVWHVSVSKK
ncbi:sorbosone dehydrogenase family protein [Arcicella aquatica]|uniref:Sorbosone dehydrogenase family protein n=1 Tax=Arcicella aquatica TaxID=217141 RepID=A0ABU5QSK1_9BACT|nr:sorbosone dehydrogenase family protein [Arcicella aquatica]MEA5259835.1 sorbosone dehydrogenase family protein [Arcicella aquatica]